MANKCNHLVSANNLSLDPTLLTIAGHTVNTNNDEATVITSNRSPCTKINVTWECDQPSLAATARAIFGNPVLQYLNALAIAANEAITDTGATPSSSWTMRRSTTNVSLQNPSKIICLMVLRSGQHTCVT